MDQLGLPDSMVHIILTNAQSSDQPYNYSLIHGDIYSMSQPHLINIPLIYPGNVCLIGNTDTSFRVDGVTDALLYWVTGIIPTSMSVRVSTISGDSQ